MRLDELTSPTTFGRDENFTELMSIAKYNRGLYRDPAQAKFYQELLAPTGEFIKNDINMSDGERSDVQWTIYTDEQGVTKVTRRSSYGNRTYWERTPASIEKTEAEAAQKSQERGVQYSDTVAQKARYMVDIAIPRELRNIRLKTQSGPGGDPNEAAGLRAYRRDQLRLLKVWKNVLDLVKSGRVIPRGIGSTAEYQPWVTPTGEPIEGTEVMSRQWRELGEGDE